MSKRFISYCGRRTFSKSIIWSNLEKSKPNAKEASVSVPPTSSNPSVFSMDFIPSEYDKKVLLWSGRYKSRGEIPPRINFETLNNARSRLRIRISNTMIVISIGACFFYIWLGKKKRSEGDSITKRVFEENREILRKAKG